MIQVGMRVWVKDPSIGRTTGVVVYDHGLTDQLTKLWTVRLDENGLYAPVPETCLSPKDQSG